MHLLSPALLDRGPMLPPSTPLEAPCCLPCWIGASCHLPCPTMCAVGSCVPKSHLCCLCVPGWHAVQPAGLPASPEICRQGKFAAVPCCRIFGHVGSSKWVHRSLYSSISCPYNTLRAHSPSRKSLQHLLWAGISVCLPFPSPQLFWCCPVSPLLHALPHHIVFPTMARCPVPPSATGLGLSDTLHVRVLVGFPPPL